MPYDRSRAPSPVEVTLLLRGLLHSNCDREMSLIQDDLTAWLTSRISRRVDGLPEWIAILGSSSGLACPVVSAITVFNVGKVSTISTMSPWKV